MSELDKRLAALETELKDLAFMERQGYITEGVRGNQETKGQLRATILNAQEALEDVKNAANTTWQDGYEAAKAEAFIWRE